MLREWSWQRRPDAIAWIPSRRRPALIGSVAAHLARVGRLSDLGPLELSGDGPRSGEPGGNSAFRLAEVWNAWRAGDRVGSALAESTGADEPVILLVDDLVDSRWTMTVAGRELRRAGAAQVLPFALAVAG